MTNTGDDVILGAEDADFTNDSAVPPRGGKNE